MDSTGNVEWVVTFIPTDAEVIAELYDDKGNVLRQKFIPCRPPINCPFTMTDVEFGVYKAGVAYDGKRYYFVQGQSQITVPDDLANASLVDVEANTTPHLELSVDAS